jgi:5-(carboxyamino)imidazole ribonucleotide synthase
VNARHSAILPGSTVGVLGSGQLGRMFAIAARQMGYRVHTYSPDDDTPTGQVADREFQGSYDDLDRVRDFARNVDVVTFEFENVSAAATEAAAEFALVRPSGHVLHITQHRLREKQFLSSNGFPVTPYRAVASLAGLHAAIAALGTPCVLKTAGFGYDGKGQVKIPRHATPVQIDAAWKEVGAVECVLEAFVDFSCELSMVAARAADGGFAHYGLVENSHAHHILDITTAPAEVAPDIRRDAEAITRGILEELQVEGVLCVEFFLTRDGCLLVNELAPRPHNSGHFTIDACLTSQFEQQLRAVCGLTLGSTQQFQPAAMANLLGDVWFNPEGAQQTPDWQALCSLPGVKLHLYGKLAPRRGRKMGHLTALAATAREAAEQVRHARALLSPSA